MNQLKESVPKLHKIFIESTIPSNKDETANVSFEMLVAKNASWVFNASQLRDKLFEIADIKVKHKLSQEK